MPKISVIIPTYNRALYLSTAIESILNEAYRDYELIIVDDGSTDDTPKLMRSFEGRCIYLKQANAGPAAARNKGINAAKGEYLAFLDTDCTADKSWLGELLKKFDREDIGIVAGKTLSTTTTRIVERYAQLTDKDDASGFVQHPFRAFANTGNMMVRRDVFEKAGLLCEDLPYAEDNEFSWRVLEKTNFKIAFAKDAIIWHKHRSTLKGLLKQRFHYGYGKALLYKRFNGYRKTFFSDTLEMVWRILIFSVRSFVRLLKYPFTPKRETIFVFEHPLAILCSIAGFFGILSSRMRNRIWP